MYLIKRIIKSYITIVNILVQSVFDVIKLVLSPLSLPLKLVLNRRKRRNDKPHKHDNYQSQIDGINTVIKDIKLSVIEELKAKDYAQDKDLLTNWKWTENAIKEVKVSIIELTSGARKQSERIDGLYKADNECDGINSALLKRIDDNNERIDTIDALINTRHSNYEYQVTKNIDTYNRLVNRVNELELSQEDSTLTIFPDTEEMTTDEHVQHAMATHEREEGRVKEYDYHSELKSKEKSNE